MSQIPRLALPAVVVVSEAEQEVDALPQPQWRPRSIRGSGVSSATSSSQPAKEDCQRLRWPGIKQVTPRIPVAKTAAEPAFINHSPRTTNTIIGLPNV